MKSLKARTIALAAALAVLLLAGVGATTAYLHRSSRLTNTFQLATVNVDIAEDFDGTTKENVAIENTANTPVYIRATVLFAWTDGSGRVLADIPQENTDYTLAVGVRNNWVLGSDGYYYYTKPVAPGKETTNLLDTLTKTATGTSEKVLSVTIAAQAVQASPSEAVHDLWGATVDEHTGVLTPREEVAP